VWAARLVLAGLTATLVAAWLIAEPRTPDLAAQIYRVDVFRQIGMGVWDEHWYAGHHLPGYSLIFPALGALLGVRLVGALAVVASTVLFERLARSLFGSGGAAAWGTVAFALAAAGDVWVGRMAFAVGVSLALAAGLALARDKLVAAALLSGLCAAASPVAGMLLGLAGVTLAITSRAPRPALATAVPATAVVVSIAALFPEGGYEPYPLLSFTATAVVVLAFVWAVGPRPRTLRVGALVYLFACVVCLLVQSPVGSNIERYGVLLAGPLLVCARLSSRRLTGMRGVVSAVGVSGGVALAVWSTWVVWGPVRETLAVAGSEATSASYYAPVERFLATHEGEPMRVEVPFTRSHWEAALLAPTVSLARGWEKQLDTRYDGALLSPSLTAGSYLRWLREDAVSYVALPDVRLDPSSAREGRLIAAGLPYLREVFTSQHWRIYAVVGATPLASGPARVTALGHDSFKLGVAAPGRVLVRVRYTRYWTLTRGSGCVSEAPGGWTEVQAREAGTVEVAARFSLGGAFGAGPSCRGS
jgi:hypothetical protein